MSQPNEPKKDLPPPPPVPPVPPTPANWKAWAGWLAAWILPWLVGVILGWLGYPVMNPAPPPVPIWQQSFGWIPDPQAVAEVQKTLEFRTFGETPAGRAAAPDVKAVYLWQAVKKVTKANPPAKNQGQVGSCVSFGTNNAIYRTMAVQIGLKGAAEELKDICEEVTYAGSRVEVGGGRIRGDGSNGSWAAKFVRDWGIVERASVLGGKYDLSKYDQSRCRQWGNAGVPEDLEALAKQHPVKEITLVRTWEEAKTALANGYGIAICSGQGFSMQRDSRGIAKASGSWAHCMCLDGFHIDDDGREYGHIENSWGPEAHRGPVGWGDPSTAGFWADSKTISSMLREGDTWAFSSVKGFPAQHIDWFVFHDQPRPAHVAAAQRIPNLEVLNHATFAFIRVPAVVRQPDLWADAKP